MQDDDGTSAGNREPSFRPYVEAGLTLIPLRRRSKVPRDTRWQRRPYDSAAVLREALVEGGNVGVRLPREVVVLDVDPRHFVPGENGLLDLRLDFAIPLEDAPHTVTGGEGHHYWFRKPADVDVVDSIPKYPGVEFKSAGRQVVAAGSVHPSGGTYRWADDSPPLSAMPDLPVDLLGLIRRPERMNSGASAGELTPEVLAETLAQLEAAAFRDHDQWLKLMMAAHHATAGLGREEFLDWSSSDPVYADRRGENGRRWDSLHLTRTRGRPVTVKYLHKVLQEHGGQVAVERPEDAFEAIEEAPEGHDRDWSAGPLGRVGDDWVWVADAGQFIRREDRKRYRPDQWQSMFGHLVPDGSVLNRLWKSRRLMRKFEALTYLPNGPEFPGGETGDTYNLWREDGVPPSPGDVSWFLGHMAYLVPDERERGLVLDYLAHLVQRPEVKVNFALVIRGEQGTGKSAVGELMRRIIGAENVAKPGNEEIGGPWTGWQERAQLAILEELMTHGRLDVANALKPLITDPTLRIKEKFCPNYTIENRLNLLCFTNHRDAVNLEAGDRRWFIVFSPARPKPAAEEREYFDCLFGHINGEGAGHVAHWLMARDLSGFNAKGRAPETAAKQEMRELSLPGAEAFLLDRFHAGEPPFDFDLVAVEEVEDVLPDSLRRGRRNLRGALSKFLADELRAVQHTRNTSSRGSASDLPKRRLWSVRDHDHWEEVGPTERARAHHAHRNREFLAAEE